MTRLAIIDGLRSPFCKSMGQMAAVPADALAARVAQSLLARSPIAPEDIDEVIVGNVSQPAEFANIARIIARLLGLPEHIPAYTVHRNCASGMEAITSASDKIAAGRARCILTIGTESMSSIPCSTIVKQARGLLN